MATTERVSAGKAHTRYRLRDGTIVPGVTTVLGVLNKPALVTWANDLGLKGINVRGYVDALAQIGSLAHALIEHDLGAPEPDLSLWSAEHIDKAENCLLKWYEWRKHHEIQPILIEAPLVSEVHRFGGTLDCLAAIDGVLTILDIKTAQRIYPEHLHQVAAYTILAEEHGHAVEAVRVLQVGRTEDEGFSEHVIPVARLAPHRRIFECCLEIYRLQQQLKEVS
jgi:hypothetical protein